MRVLSLDTTTRAGSVALADDAGVVEERSGDPSRTHAERLPDEILSLLEANAVPMSAIDVFAVASGPGSFTGLRIGIATIQGFAFVHRRPVAAVSALLALGAVGGRDAQPGDVVGAWMDAHRHDVFSALYRVGAVNAGDPDRLVELEGAMVGDPVATLERWHPLLGGATTMVGDGAILYADTIDRSMPPSHRIVRPAPLLAGAIGCMALVLARSGRLVDAGGIQPLYVRRPDAELDRERKKALG
ncbi:MAG: tRNA (adenosine(37)-N6)-threonylcarbamoyltransferase complex dimerization subunit type 1 TsaB [Vulcanimicrobiaceae bacterium]